MNTGNYICSIFYITQILKNTFNPLPLLFKALLHGQKGCVFFSGHLNVEDSKSALECLGRQGTFKSRALWSVRDGKGLNVFYASVINDTI
jgi:hypothetical protein